jgi:hypothetical protein
MVIVEITRQDSLQMTIVQHHNMVQTVSPDAANDAFHKCILPGASRRIPRGSCGCVAGGLGCAFLSGSARSCPVVGSAKRSQWEGSVCASDAYVEPLSAIADHRWCIPDSRIELSVRQGSAMVLHRRVFLCKVPSGWMSEFGHKVAVRRTH